MKSTFTKSIFKALLPCAVILSGVETRAQVSITTLGVPYSENFDALVNTGTNALLIPGWSMLETGVSGNIFYTAGTGSLNTGDTYSYGSTGSTDRALGSLASGSLNSMYGASYLNNSGSPITNLAIGYIGEQWRCGATGRQDSLVFQYSLDATSLVTGTWINVPTLNFKSPNTAGPVGALIGNLITNEAILSANITGLNIANGTGFWVRWTDPNITGSDDGLAVDNFALTPTFVNSLSVSDVSLNEGNAGTTSFDFTVSLSGPADIGGVTFDITTIDFTAIAPGDYTAQSLTGQTIPQGSTSYTFSVLVNGDITVETNDTFFVNVTNVVGATAVKSGGLGVIINDDYEAPVVFTDPAGTSYNCAGQQAVFYSTANGIPTPTVQWQVSTDGGTNWNDIIGATSNILTLSSVAVSDSGNLYHAVFTNIAGNATSAPGKLIVYPVSAVSNTAYVCSGGSYTFADGTMASNITSTVSYTSHLTNIYGCDSAINTTVNVYPVYNISTNAGVCNNGSYTFPDGTIINNITSQTIHVSNLLTVNTGCDSIITTTVDVLPVNSHNDTAFVCYNSAFAFHDGFVITNIIAPVSHTSILTSAFGCDSIINTYVDTLPRPVVVANSNSFACEGEAIFLTATTIGGAQYIWTGPLSYSIALQNPIITNVNPGMTGTYTVSVLDTNGCSEVASTFVLVNPLPDITTSIMGTTIMANQSSASYQWIDCGNGNVPINGETGQSFTATVNGFYAVEIMLNGCMATSACDSINGIGLKDISSTNSEIKVYPNPAQNLITIEFQSDLKTAKLSLVNSLGQVVLLKEIANSNKIQLNLQDVNAGIYYLQIEHNGGKTVKRITKE